MGHANAAAPYPARGWIGDCLVCRRRRSGSTGPVPVCSVRTVLMVLLYLALFPRPSAAGPAYLEQRGPSPLRFSPPVDDSKVFVRPALLAPRTGSTNVSQAYGPTQTNAIGALTNEASTAPTNAPASGVVVQAGPSPTPVAPPPTFNVAANPLSPNGLVLVTPQMLAELLRPGVGGTNGPPMDPADLENFWFVPPTPAPRPSSEAIYHSR